MPDYLQQVSQLKPNPGGLRLSLESVNQAFYAGDTFQFYIGLLPDAGNAKQWREIESQFTSANLTREGVDKYASAIASNEPNWHLKKGNKPVARGESNEVTDSAEIFLKQVLDTNYERAWGHSNDYWSNPLLKAVTDSFINGRGYLRIYEDSKLALSPDPLDSIVIHSPDPGSVRIERDKAGHIEYIDYHYGEHSIERQTLDVASGILKVEILENEEPIDELTFFTDLGGRYTIAEIKSSPIITQTVRRLQQSADLALTMLNRNMISSGHRERYATGAELPDSIEIGAGRLMDVQGKPLFGEMGQLTGYTNPGVTIVEPVAVNNFRETIEVFRTLIYHEMSLGHLLASGDGSLSGRSRIEMKRDWEVSLRSSARTVGSAYGNILGVALHRISDATGRNYRNLEPVIDIVLNLGHPAPEEQDQARNNYNAGLFSRTTAMASVGVEDPDAEQELIRREKEDEIELAQGKVAELEQAALNAPPPGQDVEDGAEAKAVKVPPVKLK